MRDDGKKRLHVMILGVLAAYRGLGIAAALLRRVLRSCMEDSDVVEAYLHVQVGNDAALSFYEHMGFERCPYPIEDYYVGVEERRAVRMRRWLADGARSFSVE